MVHHNRAAKRFCIAKESLREFLALSGHVAWRALGLRWQRHSGRARGLRPELFELRSARALAQGRGSRLPQFRNGEGRRRRRPHLADRWAGHVRRGFSAEGRGARRKRGDGLWRGAAAAGLDPGCESGASRPAAEPRWPIQQQPYNAPVAQPRYAPPQQAGAPMSIEAPGAARKACSRAISSSARRRRTCARRRTGSARSRSRIISRSQTISRSRPISSNRLRRSRTTRRRSRPISSRRHAARRARARERR